MNTAMKMSALLIVVLLGSLELVSSAPGSSTGAGCCTKYETKRIPLAMVVSWHETSNSCAKAAYVFVTKRGRRICVDPTHGWVRNHTAQVDSRSATTIVPGTSKIKDAFRPQELGPKLLEWGPISSATNKNCCPNMKKGPEIPLMMVASYYKSSSSCPKAAVVFVTKRGRRICVDPSEKWVPSHMTHVDRRSREVTTVSSKTTSAAAFPPQELEPDLFLPRKTSPFGGVVLSKSTGNFGVGRKH